VGEKKKAEREELERQQRLAELEVRAREDVIVAGRARVRAHTHELRSITRTRTPAHTLARSRTHIRTQTHMRAALGGF